MVGTHGHALPWVDTYVGRALIEHRDLPASTRCGTAELAFSHPAMQEVLLQAARDAGATVLRGGALRELQPGPLSTAVIELDGHSRTIQRGWWSGPMAACRPSASWLGLRSRPTRPSA